MVDYSLWEVIENGNKPPITTVVKGVETIIAPVTAEEKAQRRLELKARSTLLMGISNEHQLKFNSIKDAKSLLQAIETRFRGNATTKKTQGNLLNQQYENFTASSSKVLDQTFDRLQKLISQLEILGESILQKDVNQKFLRSLSPEWNTYTIVWRNKPDIDTWSLDDLYNNLKGQKISEEHKKKLNLNRNETDAFDKTKAGCYNFHKRGHFARECSAPKAQNNKNIESTRIVPVKTPASSALVLCDGLEDSKDEAESRPKIEKKTVKPSFPKIEFVKSKEQVNSPRKTIVRQVEKPRQHTHKPRGNHRNWNNMMSQRLGKPKSSQDDRFKPSNDVRKKVNEVSRQEHECKDQKEKENVYNTNRVNVVNLTVNAASNEVNVVGIKSSIKLPDDPNMPELEDISIFDVDPNF
uniref:Ribonuclease H-like domain-containing protein n=1 Tax=Tanacetum cinerariifolium TaxID=118510 RepID=A0A6L2MZE0_TANCI|nr:ribonuclease H-like domain-containing protein [Tanacetum cinerariifolium]